MNHSSPDRNLRSCHGLSRLIRSKQRRTRSGANRSGAALVEFAFVVPVFVLLLGTCIEFCRLNMIRNLVQDAAYYASRYCIVPGATAEEATAEANRILAAMGTQGATITINDGNGLSDDSDFVKVHISVPVAQNALMATKFTGDITLESESNMRTERYDGYYDPAL